MFRTSWFMTSSLNRVDSTAKRACLEVADESGLAVFLAVVKWKVPMTIETNALLDHTGWRILCLLQNDGRLSFSEIGRQVGLTAPAVAERVRKLEDAGIITGYHAQVNPAKVGYPILAIIRIGATN